MARARKKVVMKSQMRASTNASGRHAKSQRSVRTGPVSEQEAAERRLHVLEIAGDEFLKKGFWQASVAAIAKKSHVSKGTIYREHGCKENLFQEFMSVNIKDFRRAMEHTVDPHRPLADVLRDAVRLGVSAICDKRTLALLRLTIAERDRFPTVARMVSEEAQMLWRPLALCLRSAAGPDRISVRESEQRTLHIMNMAIGGIGGLLDNPVSYFGNQERWVESVVQMLLDPLPARQVSHAALANPGCAALLRR